MFVYTPSPETAYQDMLKLQTEVWFGQFIRNLHHWSGNLLVMVAFLHLLRVFFTGGFRAPAKFNWILGYGVAAAGRGRQFHRLPAAPGINWLTGR